MAPPKLEDAFIALSGVNDTGFIDFGHNQVFGEHPVEFAIRVNLSVTAEDLKQQHRHHLTRHKVNYCDIRFIEAIPKSVTGKILTNELHKFVT